MLNQSLEGLIERVGKATGPDREIDRDMHAILDGWDKVWNDDLEFFQLWKDGKWIGLGSIPAYTASIDAALALVERMLPGWGCQVGRPIQKHSSGWYASVFRERLPGEHGTFDGHFSDYSEPQNLRPRDSYRPNGALAIVLASLRSLQTGDAK